VSSNLTASATQPLSCSHSGPARLKAQQQFHRVTRSGIPKQGQCGMASTDTTLADMAHAKAQRAKEMVDTAEAELKQANATLERAIPKGDVREIQDAHQSTQKAEKAVVEAGQELDVVEVLLDSARGAGGGSGAQAGSTPA
jgi:hypothetical protein